MNSCLDHSDKPDSPLAWCASGAILFGATLLGASATWAQERPAEPPASSWSAGAFASTETSPYRGADDTRRWLPLVAFENAYVRWAGPMLDIKLPSTGAVSFALRARYTDAGYKASDSVSLAGMVERKSSIWLGAKAEWQHDFGQLSAEWLADAANHSGGQQIKLTAEKPMGFGRLRLAPRVALLWQDSDQVDYYFGVRSSEARTGRSAYAGQSTVNTELGLRAFYGLDRQQSLFMDLHATALGAAIKDSPLVDRSWVSGLRLGYAYRF
ncbi:MipA/OmpV family protein [Hydrogenophaga sp. PAMC20947]|uniref:MipA/OmpV family protein n=1 Tax=Hydrogenophaga sp. PAMC20947 TaxID=2565558 RepID=UPI001447363F|nr:MipA/OmpV family protein [Hydrogenophaga sp. PAMC20947]